MTITARQLLPGPILYSLSVSVAAGMASFLALLIAEQFMADKEQAMGYGVLWFFSLPWILLAGFVGLFTYARFKARASWIGSTVVYAGTIAMAIVIGSGLSVVFVASTR